MEKAVENILLPSKEPFTVRINPEHIAQIEALAKAQGVAPRTIEREAIEFFLNARKIDSTKACA